METMAVSEFKKWIDMIKFLKNSSTPWVGNEDILDEKHRGLIRDLLDGFGIWAEKNGLTVTSGLTKSLVVHMRLFDSEPSVLRDRLQNIDAAYELEIASHHLIYLDQGKEKFIFKTNPFGEEVALAFPGIGYDLEEACSCFAINRSTACVFHLMRVLEVLFECILKHFGVTEVFSTWGHYLKAINTANRAKYKAGSEESLFFSDLESQLWAIKNGWRDDALHSVAAKYSESEAYNILKAVEGVMKKAATRLKQDTA